MPSKQRVTGSSPVGIAILFRYSRGFRAEYRLELGAGHRPLSALKNLRKPGAIRGFAGECARTAFSYPDSFAGYGGGDRPSVAVGVCRLSFYRASQESPAALHLLRKL